MNSQDVLVTDKRYELFGWDYDHINPLSPQEIAWYTKFVEYGGGSVLELACGTGRLLAEMAKQGSKCVGIDSSSTMLEIAKRHASTLSPEISSRITLHKMDMIDLEFDEIFDLIILADNTFRIFTTREQQLSCLKCVYRHLAPQGKFLVSVRRFDPARYPRGRRKFGWSEPVDHPRTKEVVMRRGEMTLLEGEKRMRSVFYYKIIHKDGSESIEECSSEISTLLTADFLSLFSEAKFCPSVYVGYEELEDDGENPILCFVCDKEQSIEGT